MSLLPIPENFFHPSAPHASPRPSAPRRNPVRLIRPIQPISYTPHSQKLLEIIEVFVKRLLQRCERGERRDHADRADDDRAAFEAEVAACELEEHRDRHHHAAHEVRHGRRYRGPEVGAELLGGYGHENRPVAAGKSESERDPVEERRRRVALHEIERDGDDVQHKEHQHRLFAALQHLAEQSATQVAEDKAEVAEHHGVARRHRALDAERRGEFGREGDQHAHHEPDRHADENRVQVAEKAVAAGEERQEVALADRRLVLHRLEHARLGDLEPRHQQNETKRAANEKGRAPVVVGRHRVGQNRASHANRSDQHRAVAANLGVQNLRNQRNARPQLARKPDARDEAQRGVGL